MGEVGPREDPAGGALEDLDRPRSLHQFGNDLNSAGSGADHGDTFVAHVVVVIPTRTVDLVTIEGVQSADVRQARIRQRPTGHHCGARRELRAVSCLRRPQCAFLVELQTGDVHSEPDETRQRVLVDHRLDVAEDLGAARIRAGPVRILLEPVGIEQRRDVARRAGIGVVPPGTTHLVGTFKDNEIVDTLL